MSQQGWGGLNKSHRDLTISDSDQTKLLTFCCVAAAASSSATADIITVATVINATNFPIIPRLGSFIFFRE